MTHTLGPWEVDLHHGIAIRGEDNKRVCRIPVYNTPKLLREADANARLIAAAPELLAALRHAQEALFWHKAEAFEEGGITVGERVRAAIAKATGEKP